MHNPKTGVKIKNRRYYLRIYENSFVGREGVGWLVEELGLEGDREMGTVSFFFLKSGGRMDLVVNCYS